MLDAWENVGGGLYRAEILAVRRKRCLAPALVYFARPGGEGRPKPGYIELVRRGGAGMGFAGNLHPFAGRLRVDAPGWAGRAQDRRVPMTDPPRRVPRPGARRRLPRLCRGRGGADRRRGLGAQPPRRHRRSDLRRRRQSRRGHHRGLPQGLLCRPRRRRRSARRRAPTSWRCVATTSSRCCRPSELRCPPPLKPSARTAARTRAAAPCRPRPC